MTTAMCVKSEKILKLIMPTCSRSLRNDNLSRLMTSSQKKFPSDVMLDEKLSPNQQNEIRLLLQGFPDTLSDLPDRTQRTEHTIRLVDDTPFRIKQYQLPVHAIDSIYAEINAFVGHHKMIIVTIRFSDRCSYEKG